MNQTRAFLVFLVFSGFLGGIASAETLTPADFGDPESHGSLHLVSTVGFEPDQQGGVQAKLKPDALGPALRRGEPEHPNVTLLRVSATYCPTCREGVAAEEALSSRCRHHASFVEFLDEAMDDEDPSLISAKRSDGELALQPWLRARHPIIVVRSIDKSPEVQARLSKDLPATLILVDGQVVGRVNGAVPSAERVTSIVRASGIAGTQNFSCGN